MFQTPQYRPIMQLQPPGQIQRPPGMNPMMAPQQPQQQPPNPMGSMQQGMQMGQQMNPQPNPLNPQPQPNPLMGSLQNPAPNNAAANASYDQLAHQDQVGGAQNMMSSGIQNMQPNWWMRNFGNGLF